MTRSGLRILQVVHGFPPSEQAGAELCCYYLSREFRDRGHEVRVLTATGAADLGAYEQLQEQVDGLEVLRLKAPLQQAGALLDTYRDRRVEEIFLEQLERGTDVVHVHHVLGLSSGIIQVAAERNIPTVVTLHDFWYLCPRGQRFTPRNHLCTKVQPWRCSACIAKKRVRWTWNAVETQLRNPAALLGRPLHSLLQGVRYVRDNLLRRPIDRRLEHLLGQLNRAQLCLSPSQFLLAEYQRHGLREPQCEHSENGVEVDWAQSLTPRTQRSQRLRFGFIGSFLPSKGVDLLVQAFQDIAPGEAELHLYGTSLWDGGRFANRVERSNRHPDVHFHGAFAHDQLAKVLDFLDVLVVPSRWFENAPLTLDEAALAERPVIGSDHGGLREIILRRGNGLLFRPGDAPSLLQSLRRFIDEPALWEKLRRSKLPVRTVAQQASELLEHYQRLLHLGQT